MTAAVNPQATGFPPVSDSRILRVGVNVVGNERIVTTASGEAQMLFLDESALTIGPNAEVVLDEFFYNPDRKTGKLVLAATKGLFRLVGGRISKTNPVVLKTPTATIGIRGGIAIVDVAPTGLTEATFLFGQGMQVTSGGVTKEVVRPGYAISAESADQPPSDPAPASAKTLNAALGSLEGGGTAAAGEGEETPQDEQVAASGLDELGSEQEPDDVAPTEVTAPAEVTGGTEVASDAEDESNTDEPPPAAETNPTAPPLTIAGTLSGRIKHATTPANGTDDGSSTLDLTFDGATVTDGTFTVNISSFGAFTAAAESGGEFSVTATAQLFGTGTLSGTGFVTSDDQFVIYELTDQDDNHKVLAFAGTPTPASAFPTSGATFYSLQNDFVLGSSIPFARASNGGTLVPGTSEAAVDTAIFWDVTGSTTAQRPWAHLTMVISGQGPSQTSVFSAAGGEVLLDSSSRAFISGGTSGTSRLSSTGLVGLFDGDLASADDALGNDFFGTTGPDYFVLVGEDVEDVNNSDVVLSGGILEFVPGTTTDVTYFPNAIALKATDTLDTRTSRLLFGYSGGAIQSSDSSGSLVATALFRNATGDPDDITVITSAETGKVQAFIEVGNAFSANALDAFGSSLEEFEIDFGNHYVGAFASTQLSIGDTADTVNTHGESTFIDDFAFGASNQESGPTGQTGLGASFTSGSPLLLVDLVMFTVDEDQLTGTGFIPSGVTLCECQFLTWGFWGGNIERSGNADEFIHLANWVAGEIQPLSAILALSGTASYAGHAIGTVLSASDVYQVVGDVAATVNFDTDVTTGTLSDFDG